MNQTWVGWALFAAFVVSLAALIWLLDPNRVAPRPTPRPRPERSMSPIELYVAGGGDMSTASPRLQDLLLEAEKGYQRGEAQRSRRPKRMEE